MFDQSNSAPVTIGISIRFEQAQIRLFNAYLLNVVFLTITLWESTITVPVTISDYVPYVDGPTTTSTVREETKGDVKNIFILFESTVTWSSCTRSSWIEIQPFPTLNQYLPPLSRKLLGDSTTSSAKRHETTPLRERGVMLINFLSRLQVTMQLMIALNKRFEQEFWNYIQQGVHQLRRGCRNCGRKARGFTLVIALGLSVSRPPFILLQQVALLSLIALVPRDSLRHAIGPFLCLLLFLLSSFDDFSLR
ncbi:hypothetical protein EAF04_002672 [Stromatinia cepivora]|nr:hypothetical protein EAF04_002672 [Stromatinia cepivora]